MPKDVVRRPTEGSQTHAGIPWEGAERDPWLVYNWRLSIRLFNLKFRNRRFIASILASKLTISKSHLRRQAGRQGVPKCAGLVGGFHRDDFEQKALP